MLSLNNSTFPCKITSISRRGPNGFCCSVIKPIIHQHFASQDSKPEPQSALSANNNIHIQIHTIPTVTR